MHRKAMNDGDRSGKAAGAAPESRGEPAAADLKEIARTLDAAARAVRRHARLPADAGRALIAARRFRQALLPDLHGDHAFSLLLELYAAHLDGRRIAQTRLGGLAGAPQPTAIRIIHALLEAGLIDRTDDPADRRLVLLGLTDEAVRRMEAYLSRAMAAGALLL
jgi:DNA-binding MarR family transcriptional regulator